MQLARPRSQAVTDPEDLPWTHVDRWFLGAALLVATITSFWGLGREPLWLDEATTFFRASKPVDDLVKDSIHQYHVPTYFLLIRYWMKLGDSEAMLRAPSALLAVAAVGMCFLLGRVAGGRTTGLVAALLLTLSRFQITFAQEARMYSLLLMVTTASTAGALWLIRHPNAAAAPLVQRSDSGALVVTRAWRWWLMCIAGVTLALYTHNAAAFFAATLALTVALASLGLGSLRWKVLTNWIICGAVVVVAYLPWLGTVMAQTAEAESEGEHWGKSRTVGAVLHYVGGMFSMPSDQPLMYSLGLLLIALALVATWRTGRRTSLSLLAFSLMPIAIVLIVSLQRPMFLPRILIGCTAPAHVLIGLGASTLVLPLFSAAVGVLMLCAIQLLPAHYGVLVKEEWPQALNFIEDNWKEGAIVLSVGGREARQIRYYYKRKSNPFPKRPFFAVHDHNVEERIRLEKPTTIFTVTLRRSKRVATPVLEKIAKEWRTGRKLRTNHIGVIEFRPIRRPKT